VEIRRPWWEHWRRLRVTWERLGRGLWVGTVWPVLTATYCQACSTYVSLARLVTVDMCCILCTANSLLVKRIGIRIYCVILIAPICVLTVMTNEWSYIAQIITVTSYVDVFAKNNISFSNISYISWLNIFFFSAVFFSVSMWHAAASLPNLVLIHTVYISQRKSCHQAYYRFSGRLWKLKMHMQRHMASFSIFHLSD